MSCPGHGRLHPGHGRLRPVDNLSFREAVISQRESQSSKWISKIRLLNHAYDSIQILILLEFGGKKLQELLLSCSSISQDKLKEILDKLEKDKYIEYDDNGLIQSTELGKSVIDSLCN